jgi:hypothetical protein
MADMEDEQNPPRGDVTELLARAHAGDRQALDRLLPIVYAELRRVAERQMRGERPDHTLGVSGLVHEAYLRLAREKLPE